MTHKHPFAQVDVFSREPYRGNPVAVILDADGLNDAAMQRIATWTNLSETTFILDPTTPEADYRVRIFTPTGELPFAGHPTLGSARAWLEHGGIPKNETKLVQECAAGLIEIRQENDMLSFAAPPIIRSGPLDDGYLEQIVRAYGIARVDVIDHQWVDNGPGWAVLRLASAERVLALEPDFSRLPDAMVGAVGAYPAGSPAAFELRAFAPRANVAEDPVCGSMNASVAQWLTGSGEAPTSYSVPQGARLGRAGEININVDGDTIWVGGATAILFQGAALISGGRRVEPRTFRSVTHFLAEKPRGAGETARVEARYQPVIRRRPSARNATPGTSQAGCRRGCLTLYLGALRDRAPTRRL